MSSRKEEISNQIKDLNEEINRLRKLGNKKGASKEKSRLMKLMTDLIMELDSLGKDPEKEE